MTARLMIINPNPARMLVVSWAFPRHVRATLAGPVARKHFEAMSIALWGEGCRCRYTVAKATGTSREDGGVIGDGSANDARNSAGTIEIENGDENIGGNNSSSDETNNEEPDWLAFYLRRVGHRAVRPSPLDLLQVRNSPTGEVSCWWTAAARTLSGHSLHTTSNNRD